ncbi:hypothetical protein B0H11DRAFT_2216952 [Mycena galericulata]|nr:hypothetical protein B0H11DRAFT_2216952 [Mycena galericulata]
MDEEIKQVIEEMKNSTASAVWDRILRENPDTELTQKQVYAHWARLNESVWKLDPDQVKSATMLLERLDGEKIEIIPVQKEPGIEAISFSFINILRDFGDQIEEVAMDSTWKTNALGHELYGLVGEANGQSLPVSFMFIGNSDDSAETGGKERTLRHLIRHVGSHCKNIMFTGSDKETIEITGPPAAYDPRVAHRTFDFIDTTWAPGVSSGWLEDGVSEEDAEMERPADEEDEGHEPPPTCLPPVFILKTGDSRIPIWPNPPAVTKSALPIFCPKEHRKIILEKFRTHFHQHPEIPMGDEEGTFLSAAEIHHGATQDMYQYCFENDLAQVWAYMWNRWYTSKQWCLWARAACKAIPRLKTTMVVESLWKHLKHRDLAQFNRLLRATTML